MSKANAIRHPGISEVIYCRCVAPADLKARHIKVMENPQVQLEAPGETWDDVVYRRTFVPDVDEYPKVRMDPDVPRFENADKLPPSTMIGVTRLSNPEFLIEMDLMAIVEA